MKDFSNASFPPEAISIMKIALDAAVASLPDPVSSAHVQSIAESILRSAKEGERDPATLQRMALIELQISCRKPAFLTLLGASGRRISESSFARRTLR
jgi:hypothetical protein